MMAQIGRGHINRGIWEAGWLWFRKALRALPTYMLTIIVFPGVRVLSATYLTSPHRVFLCSSPVPALFETGGKVLWYGFLRFLCNSHTTKQFTWPYYVYVVHISIMLLCMAPSFNYSPLDGYCCGCPLSRAIQGSLHGDKPERRLGQDRGPIR